MATMRRIISIVAGSTTNLSFLKLLENMRPLREKISPEQAKEIFLRYGAVQVPPDPLSLKSVWKGLAKKYHEAGTEPDQEAMKYINAAYDVLKNSSPPQQQNTQGADTPDDDAPEEEWMVWGFDGRALMRGSFRVRCKRNEFPKVVDEAMKRMQSGFNRPRLVMLQNTSKFLVIYLNGKVLSEPRKILYHGDPSRDGSFIYQLQRMVSQR